MNLIVISTGSRPALLRQTLESLRKNATDWSKHTLTVVWDGALQISFMPEAADSTFIINGHRQGASASRNIGAGSIPKYARQENVMFCDDDAYFIAGWDTAIEKALEYCDLASPYAHPFNHPTGLLTDDIETTSVLSTVAMAMPWYIFDEVGPFDLPGGAGGSEDVALCGRATAKGYRLGVTMPQKAIHCGTTSSTGKPIVGIKELEDQNLRLIFANALQGRVILA